MNLVTNTMFPQLATDFRIMKLPILMRSFGISLENYQQPNHEDDDTKEKYPPPISKIGEVEFFNGLFIK